jgi:tRNA threonylcarbamoyladenosine biosynthesis protein TsaE
MRRRDADRPKVAPTRIHGLKPPMPFTLALPDEAATEALGRRLADAARPSDVIALHGPLGSGKTTLARAFIRRLTAPGEEVPSPTFTLVQTYPTPRGTIWHFDLFRLGGQDEALELGIEEAFAEGIVLIEWPERLGDLLPANRLDLRLAVTADGDARSAALGGSAWSDRLAEIGHG